MPPKQKPPPKASFKARKAAASAKASSEVAVEPAAPSSPSSASSSQAALVAQQQQRLLTVFQATFNEVLSSPDFASTLQEVKTALYNREFARAFGSEAYLDVYAARWSPTRALGYAAVLEGLRGHLEDLVCGDDGDDDDDGHVLGAGKTEDVGDEAWSGQARGGEDETTASTDAGDQETAAPQPVERTAQAEAAPAKPGKTLKMLALGGGAAELAAFASYLSSTPGVAGEVTLVDAGPWAGAARKLQHALTTPPPLSRYASAAARAHNAPVVAPGRLRHTFAQRDILTLLSPSSSSPETGGGGGGGNGNIATMLGGGGEQPVLVTLLFTLNELYTDGGIGRTTGFLRALGRALAPGSLLLVVDSPGSYSEAAVGKDGAKKRYPMHWLVDHTLLETPAAAAKRARQRRMMKEKRGGEETGGMGDGSEEEVKKEQGEEEEEKGQGEDEGEDEGCRWEKLEENDSVWFRIPEDLRYPIQLENMRYQIHLYRAVPATAGGNDHTGRR
ncbi:hypothetical protein JX265_002835 [Neoarthrinium moseri]|uniref:25S rRNA (Uridine(2843)-N(3))-methyltransferase n=1 Tax=Neoarthrinium moseri TaxID=1658444 RepID=A0A9P9WSL2_9PEZI|nr:hypothetical protein JX265_002835 [Neoarthrinium moseri]